MIYSNLFRNLKKEVYDAKQYKQMKSPFKAFAVVATLPFWFAYFACTIFTQVCIFGFNAVGASVNYLEKWLKEIKKDVNTWTTEAVIYLVVMPTIFMINVFLSFFSTIFYFLWFETMCFSYIATLGGIRWQPYISDASFDEKSKFKVTTNPTAANVISLIGFVLFCLVILLNFIVTVAGGYEMANVANVFSFMYFGFMIIAIPVTFKKVIGEDIEEAAETVNVEASKAVAAKKAVNDFDEEFPEI